MKTTIYMCRSRNAKERRTAKIFQGETCFSFSTGTEIHPNREQFSFCFSIDSSSCLESNRIEEISFFLSFFLSRFTARYTWIKQHDWSDFSRKFFLFDFVKRWFCSQGRLRDVEEELKLERDVRFRQEKELTNLRIDFDEIEQQLDEMSNARDREVDANKR